MGKDVIIALDFDSKEKTLAFLDRFTGKKPFVKIGMELFYAEGEFPKGIFFINSCLLAVHLFLLIILL